MRPLQRRLSEDRTRDFPRTGLVGGSLRRLCHGLDVHVLSRLFRASQPALSPEIRGRLVELYRDDVARLEQLLGEDLASWRV